MGGKVVIGAHCTGQPLTPRGPGRSDALIEPILEDAPHELRQRRVTAAEENALHERFVLHESWTTLKRYTHLRPEQVEERPAKAAP